MIRKILFIVNPIAGGNAHTAASALNHYLPATDFDYQVHETSGPGDGYEKAKMAASKNLDLVVACGGDGTINEVARALINSNTVLGILPCGSGNGLAKHLKLPARVPQLIVRISAFNVIDIDVPLINRIPFFNVSGIGFDAKVSQMFADDPNRGIVTYIRSVFRSIENYKPIKLSVKSPGFNYSGEAFMLSIANSSQFGNNIYINPVAKLNDGKVELCLLHPFPMAKSPKLIWQFFNKQIMYSPYFEIHSVREALIHTENSTAFHIDGDPFNPEKSFEIMVQPKALKILV